MKPTTSNNHSQPIIPKRLYLPGYFEDGFHFLSIYKGSQKDLTKRAPYQVAGSQVIKTLNLNVSGTRNVTPNQRPDRFPSIGDYIHVPTTLEHTWATPRHAVIGGS